MTQTDGEMFLGWKNQYCKNDYTTLSILQIQWNPHMDCCKGCQDTCCIWCGMRDGYGFNEGELCFILSWFGIHQSILRSWGYISVLLVLWQSCWGLSRVQSSKSRLLICLIGKTQFLCMQFRGIGPHLVARGKSHWFSRVAAGTSGIFSSCDGDAHSKRELV